MSYELIILCIYIAYLLVMSIVTFSLFVKDKKMAKNNGNEVRIKEKTLLSSVVCGGAIGGFIGRLYAHHKTEKSYFSLTIYFSILLELLTLGVLIALAL